ncbi:MAG: monomethylamine:corrinoid methyltransferase [Chloroflexi bacterium]|nr:monomethylamine:corrinoid methyltransferase [Chloroflexota bacterium]MCL5075933.1 monomethylamine:corrinoid methyltransferase [Chloroflexota bacterium]
MTLDRERLMQVLDRAHSGPLCEPFQWDTEVIPQTIAANLKRYDLQKTCEPDNPINQDDNLADRFFQAAMDTAVEVGLLCLDTQRVIKFSRAEIQQALDAAPSEFRLGEGEEMAVFRHRTFEDPFPPVWIAPLSIAVTEELFVPIAEGIARLPEVDCLEGPSLQTIWGSQLRAGSPYELLAGKLQADLTYEALRRAGREGMGLYAVGTAPTHYGVLGSYGIPGGYKPERDIVLLLTPVEMKTSYEVLHKLCQTYNCGGITYGGSWSMIGGYAGGPEGATLSCIACTLLLYTAYQASNGASFPYDMKYMGNCGRRAQWALSLVFQALSRNTHICTNSVLNQTAGPATKMLLYESAVGMLNLTVSGASSCTGPRSAGGKYTNYITPLETKFAGEVFKKTAGMSRARANDIALKLLPLYESDLGRSPKGKSFPECYDVKTLQPTDEWRRIYDEVKDEVIRAGILLD